MIILDIQNSEIMKIKKIAIIFTILAGSLLGAQENLPQMEVDNNKHPISVPNAYNDWPTLVSKLAGMSFPIGGESLTGLGFNRRYKREEILASPFIKWLIGKQLVDESIVDECLLKDKSSDGTHYHALVCLADPRFFSHIARFNEVTKAKILAKELNRSQKDNIEGQANLLKSQKQIVLNQKLITSKKLEIAQTQKGIVFLAFPFILFGFFCYGFLFPVFRALAPDLTRSAIASTNILTPNQKVIRALIIPWIINKLSFGRYFADSFPHASKEKLPKGHYQNKTESDLENYEKLLGAWSKKKLDAVPNLLLIGPPGVGKTMFAKKLFTIKDISYIETNSQALLSMLEQQGTGMVAKELAKIFEFAKNHNKKTGRKVIIFIDEADKMGLHINAILTLLNSSSSKDIVFVLACNDSTVLPEPVLSRFRRQIAIETPNQSVVRALLIEYIDRVAKVYPAVVFPKKNKALIDYLSLVLSKKGATGRSIEGAIAELGAIVSLRPEKQVTRKDLEKVFGLKSNPPKKQKNPQR